MGEAKEIIEGKPSVSKSAKQPVIKQLEEIIDDIGDAIDVKLNDLDVEGHAQMAENHFKLGILRAADSLIRRAKALLEDYGTDLEFDTDPTVDQEAASGDEFETDGKDDASDT
jgi:hypothetical protein